MELGNSEELYEVVIGDATFRGNVPPQSKMERIERRHTTHKRKRGIETPILDDKAYALEIFQETVKEWDNVNKNGKPLPCTKENLAWVWDNHSDLAGEILQGLIEEKGKAREGQEKN